MTSQQNSRCFEYILFILLFLLFTLLTFTALISFVIFIVVYFVSCFFPNYKQFLSCTDVFLDEDFINSIPQSSLVVSLTLQGNISLDELSYRFTKNVLKARSKVSACKLRYPKLKQYLTTFICFRIWKNDPDFQIKNHVVDEDWNGADLAHIHQNYLNKKYHKQRSPWELILIRNVYFGKDSGKGPVSVLVLRVHHVIGDGKSLLKLLVDFAGKKQVKTASPRFIQETRWDKLQFMLHFPLKYISESCRVIRLLRNGTNHPWNLKSWLVKSNSGKNKTVVAFSLNISLSDLKHVAKHNSVRTSAVVLSIIAGAIRQICGEKWDKEVAIGYPLPKPNHPGGLTNHLDSSIFRLPTDQQCELKRLQQCNQENKQLRDEQKERYTSVARLFVGHQIYPINRVFGNAFVPIVITNNAGDEEGFCFGNAECIDFHASVGTLRGPTGVTFCALSYKDGLRIGVSAKESVVSKEIVESLAKHIEKELELLSERTKKFNFSTEM